MRRWRECDRGPRAPSNPPRIQRRVAILANEAIDRHGLLERWPYGDVLEPARYWVHDQVNKQLQGHVSPQILPYQDSEILHFPDSLVVALYVLFAVELSAGTGLPRRVCRAPDCRRAFPPHDGRQRYCTPQCQDRHGKQVKRQALAAR